MIKPYDFKSFGARVKELRSALKVSLDTVSRATSVSVDTLRRIERGTYEPKLSSLSSLSTYYKTNIFSLLSRYQLDSDTLYLHRLIEHALVSDSLEKLERCKIEVLKVKSQKTDLIYGQMLTLLDTLIAHQIDAGNVCNADIYLSTLIICIQQTVPKFKLSHFNTYPYTFFELRILLFVATLLSNLKRYTEAIAISNYLLETYDTSIYADYDQICLHIKTIALLSYLYFLADQPKETLVAANKGIAVCTDRHSSYHLHMLYSRKAVAMKKLNHPDYEIYFTHAFSLIKMQNNPELAKKWRVITKERYNVDLV